MRREMMDEETQTVEKQRPRASSVLLSPCGCYKAPPPQRSTAASSSSPALGVGLMPLRLRRRSLFVSCRPYRPLRHLSRSMDLAMRFSFSDSTPSLRWALPPPSQTTTRHRSDSLHRPRYKPSTLIRTLMPVFDQSDVACPPCIQCGRLHLQS